MSTTPSPAQVAAVQRVLYAPARVRQLKELAARITRELNLDPFGNLRANDVRWPPGSGPNWYYPANREIDVNVKTAVAYVGQVVALLRQMHDEVAKLDLPPADRSSLTAMLDAHASTWAARAAAWQRPGDPGSGNATATIDAHAQAALTASSRVRHYLKESL